MTDARKHLSKGLMRLIRKSPFYTSLILKHEIIEDENLNSVMATNGTNLIFSPRILDIQVKEMTEVLKHEAMHVANQHHIRAKVLEKLYANKIKDIGLNFRYTFNVAADLAINTILDDYWCWTDRTLLKDGCIPGHNQFHDFPRFQTTEFYFNKLIEDYESGDLYDCIADQISNESDDFLMSEVLIDREQDLKDQVNKSESEIAKAVLMQKQAEEKFNEREKQYGTKSCSKDNVIKKALDEFESDNDINWRSELRNFFTQTTRSKQTYKKINRRHQSNNLILPTKYSKEPKKIIFLVDTSGSMSDECVSMVYTFLEEILSVSPSTSLHVAHFDDEVFEDSIKDYDHTNVPISVEDRKRQGCGGTQFVPALDYANKQNAAGCIMLTDMMPYDSDEFENYNIKIPTLFVSCMKYMYGIKELDLCTEPSWSNIVYVKEEKNE